MELLGSQPYATAHQGLRDMKLFFAGLLYMGLGVVDGTGYWFLWRGKPYVRHFLAWPFLAVHQIARVPPPAWMKPAPADLEAGRPYG